MLPACLVRIIILCVVDSKLENYKMFTIQLYNNCMSSFGPTLLKISQK